MIRKKLNMQTSKCEQVTWRCSDIILTKQHRPRCDLYWRILIDPWSKLLKTDTLTASRAFYWLNLCYSGFSTGVCQALERLKLRISSIQSFNIPLSRWTVDWTSHLEDLALQDCCFIQISPEVSEQLLGHVDNITDGKLLHFIRSHRQRQFCQPGDLGRVLFLCPSEGSFLFLLLASALGVCPACFL